MSIRWFACKARPILALTLMFGGAISATSDRPTSIRAARGITMAGFAFVDAVGLELGMDMPSSRRRSVGKRAKLSGSTSDIIE